MSKSTLADFTDLGLLGRGAYGEVYKVKRFKDKKKYAHVCAYKFSVLS